MRTALQATAQPVKDENGTQLRFWQVGYGHIDLNAAVRAVRRSDYGTYLASLQRTRDSAVLKQTGMSVPRSDF